MSGRLLFAVLILPVFLVTSPLAAAEISGTVASVEGDTITITAKSEFVPNEGDAVEVFVDVPGVGKALVANAKVTSAGGDGIVAKVVASTGRVAVGQQVTIDSPKATRRPDTQVPPMIGMTAQDAKTTAAEAGFVAKFEVGVTAPQGVKPFTVYMQNPPPGGKLARGQTVTLTLYAGDGSSPATDPAPRPTPDDPPLPPPDDPPSPMPADPPTPTPEDPPLPTPEDPPPPPAEPVSTKPWLGVSRWWVNGRDVELCGVLSDGPAGKAGLQPEDVIQTIAGKPIRSLNEFHEIIEDCDAGGEVVVEFRRDGQKQSVTVSMEAMPSDGGTGRMLAAAERGEPWAMMEMGVRYAHMRGERSYCEKDYARAVQWFGKADQAQHISAAYFLGLMYDRGNGVEQDYAEAKGLYERTRRLEGQGPRQSAFLSATRALAILYLSGHGVAQDDQMAEKLLREAADLGCLKALTHVAWMYENGRGGSGRRLSTKEYHKEAVDLYYEAAKQGYSLAQFNLGVACLEGKIVKQSNEMAVGWFRLAAEQGYGKAMYNVGWMYEQGRGVPQDRQTAITWYRKALEDGYEDARKPLEALGVSTGQAASTDLDLIQGTWECVAAFEDGKPAESFAGVLAVFEGNRLTWKRMPIEGSQTIEATFTLDPTKDPKHLDWVPNGSTDAHKRIYSLDEDTLRMSTNFGSNPRPASFEAGKWQFVMKRVKPTE